MKKQNTYSYQICLVVQVKEQLKIDGEFKKVTPYKEPKQKELNEVNGNGFRRMMKKIIFFILPIVINILLAINIFVSEIIGREVLGFTVQGRLRFQGDSDFGRLLPLGFLGLLDFCITFRTVIFYGQAQSYSC
uniref:Uncharacterized protein n=1 Tax=Rhizophagus irregularis (strain DAOM 181602 / DAOM 197198 / MUCL 43194) TaxID=747089 RepID=U9U3U3_RHIID